MCESWRDYIKAEDLPEDYQLIVQAIGLDNAIKLSQALPKIPIYLSSPEKLFKPAKTKYILDRYAQSGPDAPFNHRRIALETGLSIREVYEIIAQRKIISRQQSLFEDS